MAASLYKTPKHIIQLLKERNLIVYDEKLAERVIEERSYFSLQPYADLFIVNKQREFDGKTEFNDIVRLYDFDRELKGLVLQMLLEIEAKIKTAIGELISSRYGTRESDYLNPKIFNQLMPEYIAKTMKKIKAQKRLYGRSNTHLAYYEKRHKGTLPFWVLARILTLGAIRDYFEIMTPADQDKIASVVLTDPKMKHRAKKLSVMTSLLADVRNVCAHDDVLIGFRHRRVDIGPFPEHERLGLSKIRNGEPVKGRKDFLAVMISIHNLVTPPYFESFYGKIISLIGDLNKTMPFVGATRLLEFIGLCPDYRCM